jgi:hypothetical protein
MTKSQNSPLLHNTPVILPEPRTRANDDGSITVHIPIAFKKHGGKKYIISPGTIAEEYQPRTERSSILKALAQAFHWKGMIDRGEVSSLTELAAKLKMNESYTSRVFRLTLLAPEIIEAILGGRLPKHLTLRDFLKPFPIDWNGQRKCFMHG